MINRTLQNSVLARLGDRKVIIIYGARQVGKTTLLKEIFKNKADVMWLNGDESYARALLDDNNSERLRAIIGKNKYVVIDEAQRIENIGLKLKIIYDNIADVKVVVSGSSSFVLTDEPLTGRTT